MELMLMIKVTFTTHESRMAKTEYLCEAASQYG
jgi:hypothetical protein